MSSLNYSIIINEIDDRYLIICFNQSWFIEWNNVEQYACGVDYLFLIFTVSISSKKKCLHFYYDFNHLHLFLSLGTILVYETCIILAQVYSPYFNRVTIMLWQHPFRFESHACIYRVYLWIFPAFLGHVGEWKWSFFSNKLGSKDAPFLRYKTTLRYKQTLSELPWLKGERPKLKVNCQIKLEGRSIFF